MALEGGHCELISPEKALRDAIDYYWLLTITAPQLDLEIIPDAALDLVLCPTIDNFAVVYPPAETKFKIPLQGPIQYVGICFQSAAAPMLLNTDINDLRTLSFGSDTILTLNIETLVQSTQGHTSLETLQPVLNDFWRNRLDDQPTHSQSTEKKSNQSSEGPIQNAHKQRLNLSLIHI